MDEKWRKMVEAARADAEYALLELKLYGLARAEIAESHIEKVVARLDAMLKDSHWSARVGADNRPN